MEYLRSQYSHGTFWVYARKFGTSFRDAGNFLAAAAASPGWAAINLASIFLLTRIAKRPSYAWIGSVSNLVISTITLAWAIGVVLQFRRSHPTTLCFYFVFFIFASAVETFNFGAPIAIRSWLILIGLIFTVELVSLSLLQSFSKSSRAAFSLIYHLAVSTSVLGVFCYNLRFGVPFSYETAAAFLQTTSFEAREFVSVYFDTQVAIAVASYLVILICFAFAQYKTDTPSVALRALVAVIIFALVQFTYIDMQRGLYSATVGYAINYHKEMHALRQIELARQKSLASIGAHKNAKGETYVLVIGESQNRDHMSLYGYQRQTTPWLDKQICDSENWLRFNHPYSNYVSTVKALSLALTAANQYNGKTYIDSPSILDVMKSAGFKTYWLSNQQGLGGADNPITAIAETADVYIKINHHLGKGAVTDFLDDDLVGRFRRLKSKIRSEDNNLIVFHLMGSHQDYCRRFPASFNRFGIEVSSSQGEGLMPATHWWQGVAASRSREVNCYDDSVAFTDLVLSQIFAEAKEMPGFRSFVYMPDHAEAVDEGFGHDGQRFRFSMTHISLLVWLSDAFIKSRPEQTASLRNHENVVWTNDLLYELLVGLTGVNVKDYDSNYDLSSNKYRLDWNSARTLYGTKKVVEDPAASKVLAPLVSETACRQRAVILSAH